MNTVYHKDTKNNEEISLKELVIKIREWFQYISSKWLFILILATVGGILGFSYAYLSKTLYKAKLTFVYGETGNSQMGGLSSLASQFGIGSMGGSTGIFDGPNLLEYMTSRTIIQEVLLNKIVYKKETLTLAEIYLRVYKLRDNWKKKAPKLYEVSFEKVNDPERLTLEQNIVLGSIYSTIVSKSLKVGKNEKESSIMAIDFSSEDELFSKGFIENLVATVTKSYIKAKTKNAADNVAILQHQTDSVRRSLGSAISGVAILTDINPNPNLSRRALLVPSQNKQVDVKANEAVLTQLIQNLEIAKLSLRNQMPLIEVIDRPILPLDTAQPGVMRSVILGGLFFAFLALAYFTVSLFLKKIV